MGGTCWYCLAPADWTSQTDSVEVVLPKLSVDNIRLLPIQKFQAWARFSVCVIVWAMTDSHKGGAKNENVADSWEEAGDEATEKFFDERKKEIEAKKQKEEEMWRAREAAQQMQEQGSNFDKPAFQILKRPQGCETQSSSSQHDMAKLEEKTKTMTLQEREAAYLQARERIFGGVYRVEEDQDLAFDQMVRSAGSCVPTGVPLPHPSYHAPNPRPRLPVMMRTPRPPLYQQPLPLGIPPFRIPPPPPGAYTPSLPPVSQQRFPVAGMQHAPNTQLQRLPYFDSRIPPPAAPPPPFMGQNLGQNLIGMNPAFSDPTRNNPVPYGRPPTQLLSQNQFTLSFSDQSSRFY
uniref:SUZ domain-containing protein n=2 Tax=Wuchereria bancrofti TaxID=6293 RepID=A0A1I8ELD4_WUCBA